MPLQRSTEDIPSAVSLDTECFICKNAITDNDSKILTVCRHEFHKICINNWVKTSSTCPICSAKITKASITSSSSQLTNSPMVTRSSKSKSYDFSQATGSNATTESAVTNTDSNIPLSTFSMGDLKSMFSTLIQEQQPQLLAALTSQIPALVDRSVEIGLSRLNSVNPSHNSNISSPNMNRNPIMQTLPNVEQRTLEQLLGLPPTTQNNTGTAANALNSAPIGNDGAQMHDTSHSNTVSDLAFRPDRVSQILYNWRLKFSGTSNCLPIESFIYRVEALTNQTLNGNFDILCRNANVLFDEKAGKWYWRFHKRFPNFRWSDLCRQLRQQYCDSRTDIDIRELIRDRKQKPNESFDAFYDSVIDLADRLDQPLDDHTLVEILRRNLVPEIQHEILNLTIKSVSQLRDICRRREFFLQDMRRKHGVSTGRPSSFSRRVSELDDHVEITPEVHQFEEQVNVVNLTCWNCGEAGHRYHDCLAERNIFCYGCGAPSVYKPNCSNCNSRSKNYQGMALKSANKTHNKHQTSEK